MELLLLRTNPFHWRLHLSQLRMSAQYAILHKEESAHEEGIWCVAWATDPEDGSERIVTGGADGVVKVYD